MVCLLSARRTICPPTNFRYAIFMEIVIYDRSSKQRFLFLREIVKQDLAYVGSNCKDWGFLGMKAETIHAILAIKMCTGTWMISGLLGLKFLLKIPHRQTIDLCEQVVSWSNFEYPAATTTPEAFHETDDTYNFSSLLISRFSKVYANLDYLLKSWSEASFPNPT